MNALLDIRALEQESQAAAAAGLLHGVVVAAGRSETLDVLWAWGSAAVSPVTRPMQVDSVFDMASVTKAVATASACGVCIDLGLLDPEAPATEYLPELGGLSGSLIRVRDLATHCSGFDNRKFDLCPESQLVDQAIRAPAQWPARERFEYSCRNFIILGAIVERITGEGLATFLARHVFAPLGMVHTAFGPVRDDLERVVPTSQAAGVISDNQARKADRPIGNAGLFSTAADLARFCQMMLQGGFADRTRILGSAAMAWLMRPCSPPGLPRRSLGWDMRPCSACAHRPASLSEAAIGHSGWTGQSVWIDPQLGLYTIVLTNRIHCPGNDAVNSEPSMRFRARMADRLVTAH